MKVSKLHHPTSGVTMYRVYDDNSLPHGTINKYLSHLDHRDCSPNTSRSYAFDLVKFFMYLQLINKDWLDVDLDDFVNFAYHLQHVTNVKEISILPVANQQGRSTNTINRYISTICEFYKYYQINRSLQLPRLEPLLLLQGKRQKNSFLSFAKRSNSSAAKNVSFSLGRRKNNKKINPILTAEVQQAMLLACNNNRDKLLILLIMETGLRIGQALQLKHTDIESWNSRILMQYRNNNLNDTYAKTRKEYFVYVSNSWLNLYSDFLIHFCVNLDADYIFTKMYRKDHGDVSEPLTYSAVKDLFNRLSKKLDTKITPHMLRHTHATELLRTGVPIEIVSKVLGHASIETTKKAYEHLEAEDIKASIIRCQNKIVILHKEKLLEKY